MAGYDDPRRFMPVQSLIVEDASASVNRIVETIVQARANRGGLLLNNLKLTGVPPLAEGRAYISAASLVVAARIYARRGTARPAGWGMLSANALLDFYLGEKRTAGDAENPLIPVIRVSETTSIPSQQTLRPQVLEVTSTTAEVLGWYFTDLDLVKSLSVAPDIIFCPNNHPNFRGSRTCSRCTAELPD